MESERTWDDWRVDVERFADAVRGYVSYIEGLRDGRPKAMYRSLHGHLLAIASAESRLDYGGDDEDFPESAADELHERAHKSSNEIERHLRELVRPEAEKIDIDDHDDRELRYRANILSLDLAELYADLLEGLLIYDYDHLWAVEKAVWTWKFGYHHWGEHLYRALWTIHSIRWFSGASVAHTLDENPEWEAEMRRMLDENGG